MKVEYVGESMDPLSVCGRIIFYKVFSSLEKAMKHEKFD